MSAIPADAAPSSPPNQAATANDNSATPAGLQTWLAISVILIFIGMLVGLAFLRADQNWDRLIYLLSGFEAIVFAAAGLLFGATVSRRSALEAREDAEQAKAEAQRQQVVAESHMQGNLAGDALAKAILAKAEIQLANRRLDSGVVELALLAFSLSPELEETPRFGLLRRILRDISVQVEPDEYGR